MTPEPFPWAVTVEVPIYAVDLPVIPLLVAVAVVIGVVLLVGRRTRTRTAPRLGGE